jgi:hypothetical protein
MSGTVSLIWQEGPGVIEPVRRYRRLVVAVVLIGAVAALTWSSRQPVRYEGMVQVFLDFGGGREVDPGRVVEVPGGRPLAFDHERCRAATWWSAASTTASSFRALLACRQSTGDRVTPLSNREVEATMSLPGLEPQ